ncbi:MAG: uroporphyrinogen decarboxylase family protein [Spirochaetaceae bacterium]
MNSKERVQRTLRRELPDRVPTALWGSYYTLNDDTYFNTLNYLNLGEPLPPFRKKKPRNSNYYDDRILDAFDTDVRYIWSGFTDLGGARMDGDRKDAWGVAWRRSGPHIVSEEPPLSQAEEPEEVADYQWPDPEAYIDFELIEARLEELARKYPDRAIGARAINSYGPFEQASVLRGRESFYMDMIAEPELSAAIVEGVTDVIVRGQQLYLERIADKIDFFEIPGDDYGGTEDLMISPDHFRSMFKPALERIVRSVKEIRPDLPVVFHTDGAVSKIIPDFIEIGIDVINPLEPLPATDWAAIKREQGDRLSFMGGVDLKQALTGSVEDVERDVIRCIETFADGGGYILTSANHMQADIPPENIEAMFEMSRRHGEY